MTAIRRWIPAPLAFAALTLAAYSGSASADAQLPQISPGPSTESSSGTSAAGAAAVAYVDPFIGTQGDHGQLDPAATVPFGLVKLGPDTIEGAHSGYQYQSRQIVGFSHTRLGGIGCSGAGGTLLLRPSLGRIGSETYNKESEQAAPGYYTTTFKDGLKVELTASTRVGMHRYSFPASKIDHAMVRIDSTRSYAPFVASSLSQADASTLTGWVQAGNACSTRSDAANRGFKLFFALRFDHPIAKTAADGSGRLWADFGALAQALTLQAKVALSPIDTATATAELDADMPGWDFAASRQAAANTWNALLGRIVVADTSNDSAADARTWRTLFYTTLYRALMQPMNVTSSGGLYKRADDADTVRHTSDIAPDYVSYAGWSTWDDFHRYPLLSLVAPQAERNMAQTIAEIFQAGHISAGWADGYWSAPSVRDEMMSTVLLDAWSKGLAGGIDLGAVYDAGIPVSGNQQLQQPYTSFVIMRFAQVLGRDADIPALRARALAYQQYWAASQQDAEGTTRGFFTLDGNTVPKQDTDKVAKYFYQGSLWHYRFMVPHDIQGLVNLRGSRDALSDDLEFYFDSWRHMASNEPPLAYPFIFDFLGKPYLAQKWSRAYTTETVTTLYNTNGKLLLPEKRPAYQATPDGWLPGMDDDTGAMSAQFVFQALGLYPESVGDPWYAIGSPIFPQVTLNLPGGKQFTIRADGVSAQNLYIQSATLNGKPWTRPWITHAAIAAGGVLEFKMGPQPNTSWGADPADAPPSLSASAY